MAVVSIGKVSVQAAVSESSVKSLLGRFERAGDQAADGFLKGFKRGIGSNLDSIIKRSTDTSLTGAGKAAGDDFERGFESGFRGTNIDPPTPAGGYESQGKKSARGFGLAFKGVIGPLMALGIGKGIFDGVRDGINYASDLQEASGKATTIFGEEGAKSLEKLGSTATQQLGLTKLEVIDAASTFGTFGKAAGMQGKELAKFSGDLVGLGADLGAFYNVSGEEANFALGAALRGEAEPMRKFGVLINDAALKAEALSLGILKPVKDQAKIQGYQISLIEKQKEYNEAVKEHGKDSLEAMKAQASLGSTQNMLAKAVDGTVPALTGQQKTLAANSLIWKQTKDAQGNFAKTGGALAQQQKKLSASWTEMKGRLGKELLPAFSTIVTFLNEKFLPVLEKIDFGKIIGNVKDALKPLTSIKLPKLDFGGGGGIDPGIMKNAKDAMKSYLDLAKTWKRVFSDIAASVTKYLKPMEKDFKSIMKNVQSVVKDALSIVGSIFKITSKVVGFIWKKFGKNISDIIGQTFGLVVSIVKGNWEFIAGIFKTFSKLLKGDWKGAWETIKETMTKAMANMKIVLSKGMELLKSILKLAFKAFKMLISAAWDGVVELTKLAWRKIKQKIAEKVLEVSESIIGMKDAVVNKFKEFYEDFKNIGKNIVDGIIEGLKAAPEKLGNAVAEVGDDIKTGFKGVLGIKSPSRVFKGYGQDTVDGYVIGLNSGKAKVSKSVNKLVNTRSLADELKRQKGFMENLLESFYEVQNPVAGKSYQFFEDYSGKWMSQAEIDRYSSPKPASQKAGPGGSAGDSYDITINNPQGVPTEASVREAMSKVALRRELRRAHATA